MTLAELTSHRGQPTQAEIDWALAVRRLYTERLQQLMPAEYDTADWERARATYDAQDPGLGRDYDRSLDYLDDFKWDPDTNRPAPPPGLRYGDDAVYVWADEHNPVGEFHGLARVAQGEAQRERDAGEVAAAERLTQHARLANLAAGEFALYGDELNLDTAPDHYYAERQWLFESQRYAEVLATPLPETLPLIATPRRVRELERALEERQAASLPWSRALREVHHRRTEAEWNRLVKSGAEPSDDLAVRARQAVHRRDPNLGNLTRFSTADLIRAGEITARVDEPTAELRDRHAALMRRLEVLPVDSADLYEPDLDIEAERTALQSAADDLALSEGYAPEAFAADVDEPHEEPAPRRRHGIDLRPKLPQRPSRPTPESVTQQGASLNGPSSGPTLN